MRNAFRAKTIITLAGEGPAYSLKELEAPLHVLDDGVVVVENGIIIEVEPYAAFKRRRAAQFSLTDLGDVTLAPGLINAHCHLELSHLSGKTVAGKGFVPWLQSLVPLASAPVAPEVLQSALFLAVEQLRQSGTAHVGDVGSRNPALVAEAMRSENAMEITQKIRNSTEYCLSGPAQIGVTHFLEAFGFGPPALDAAQSDGTNSTAVLPPELAANGYCPQAASSLPVDRYPHCAVAGHALYSTSPEAMRAAYSWCCEHNRPFSMHLAEHEEEIDCLCHGKGSLYDMLRSRILPSGWTAPGIGPVAYAHRLGLLGPRTLAVHCVHCAPADIALLAQSKTSVCLCPRSNAFITVGTAPATAMAKSGILLCLGTDSLASNDDVDLRNDMLTAQELWEFSPRATLRMATVNGAHALGLAHLGTLEPGKAAVFSCIPSAT